MNCCELKNCEHTNRWLSAHIFYFDNLDNLILDGIEPVVRELQQRGRIASFFFIRYWQGGTHIRLRLLGRPEVLENEVKPYLTAAIASYLAVHPATNAIDEAEVRASHIWMVEREYQQGEFTPLFPNNSLHFINYEPEYQRYGGKIGVAIAERHFAAASETAFQVLAHTRTASNQRTGLALQLLTVLPVMLGVPLTSLSSYFINYSNIWLSYFDNLPIADLQQEFHARYLHQKANLLSFVNKLLSVLAGRTVLTGRSILGNWLVALATTACELRQAAANDELPLRKLGLPGWLKQDSPWRQQYQEIRNNIQVAEHERLVIDLIRSYLHMTCNRLGLSLFDEAYLAALIGHAVTDCNISSAGTPRAHAQLPRAS